MMNDRSLALTYPQLMNQALAQGRSELELAHLRRAYELAERMADGLYRAQGMPFICHLVRTASIVLAAHQPIEVVAAALLHSVYRLHCFDRSCRSRWTKFLRRQLQGQVPAEVESLIAGYDELPWYSRAVIAQHGEALATSPPTTKGLLVMRLANELEDYLDLGMVYRGSHPFRRRIQEYGDVLVELAHRLALPQLAATLQQAFEESLTSVLPATVVRNRRDAYELPAKRWGQKGLVERICWAGEWRLKRYLKRRRPASTASLMTEG